MSDTSIMSVGELIDTAFGDPDVNTVNFKLIHTVLLLIARQLSILERYVAVKIGYPIFAPSGSRLSIREVKVHAVVPKKDKKKRKGTKSNGEKVSIKKGDEYKEKDELGPDEDYAENLRSTSSRKKSSSDKTSPRGQPRTSSPSEDDRSFKKVEKTKLHGEKHSKEKSYDKKRGKVSKTDEDVENSGTTLQSLGSEQQNDGKRPYDKQDSKVSKPPADEAGKTEKEGRRAHSRVSSTARSDSKGKKYTQLLERLEEERERVLRVIHQRADSHEQNIGTPSPMASVSSTEIQQEKLLIVEKVLPDKDGKGLEGGKEQKRKRGLQVEEDPNLSVVTQEQFQKLLQAVKELEGKFGPLDLPFLEDLRRGVPISEALAGLQLSTRLGATEKALGRMIEIVTDIAHKTPGVNVKSFSDLKEQYGETVTKLRQAESEHGFRTGPTSVLRVEVGENTGWVSSSGVDAETKMKTISAKTYPSETVSMISTPMSVTEIEGPDIVSEGTGLWDVTKKTYVTNEQLQNSIQAVFNDYTTIFTNLANRTTQKADSALKLCTKMETDLSRIISVEKKMNELQEKIQSYVERINVLDTGLSTQMINYQEQLTQMQHDLETGLDNMAEALAAQSGDNEAMGELNQNFTILQSDFDRTRIMQKDLGDIQEAFAIDLVLLKKEIEMLRDVKSDRDEVADALRDKAGLSALNGLVSHVQFDAVRGDLEKRVRQAYDKFNSQEVVWQKAIDDLIREINEKATIQQVDTLREDIQSNLNMLKDKIDFMADLLGEPSAVAVKKQLFRDTECLSCSTPAKMNKEGAGAPEPVWPESIQSYKKTAGKGAEEGKAVGDGDHVPCIPGMPPPHSIDPRAEFCTRYCGGRHTVFSRAHSRADAKQQPDMKTIQLTRETNTVIGDDRKVYKVDYEVKKKPCHPCNDRKTPETDDKIPEREKLGRHSSASNTMGTPSDLRVYSILLPCNSYKESSTPPACSD